MNATKPKTMESFRKFKIAHQRLTDTTTELNFLIQQAQSQPVVIFLIGPTGVGKTTTLDKVKEEINYFAFDKLKYDTTSIPCVCAEAVAPESGNFSWGDQYHCILETLTKVLLERRIDPDSIISGESRRIPRYGSASSLCRSVIDALRYRNTIALMMDEAQHLCLVPNGRRLKDQMEKIKDLINRSMVPFVLAGTYELVNLLDLSGQLTRRSRVIHLQRYCAENREDLEEYTACLCKLLEQIPLNNGIDIEKHWAYFYERTVGCLGILKDWVTYSVANAMYENSSEFKMKHIKKYEPSGNQIKIMWQEIRAGENRFENCDIDLSQIRTEIGLDSVINQKPTNGASRAVTVMKSREVGKRNPTRDQVGGALVYDE